MTVQRTVYICPEAWKQHHNDTGTRNIDSTYGANSALFLPSVPTGGLMRTAISTPSRCVYLCDGRWAAAGYWPKDVGPTTISAAFVHKSSQSVNALYFDGHVGTLDPTQAADLTAWQYYNY